jgi:hypothetical protein
VSFAGPPAANMVKITNRDVFVAYPCAHEGAAVTFYLAIHGTLQAGQKIPFTLTNFPVHTKVDSDNFIVVAPQAIGTQWGNGDNGMDLPHLHEVIDWVYMTFGEKFGIRGMWASGGSWGSAYLSNFACDPMLENRLTGVRMIVGAGCPRCSARLSCIVGEQELEEGGGHAAHRRGQGDADHGLERGALRHDARLRRAHRAHDDRQRARLDVAQLRQRLPALVLPRTRATRGSLGRPDVRDAHGRRDEGSRSLTQRVDCSSGR